MKIRRDVASIPTRSAEETWRAIIDLVTGVDTVDVDQLDRAGSIMESLIADEHPANVPIVFEGAGPRVVVYCLYDEDAMEAGLDVDALATNPTAGDWKVTTPCEAKDVGWMNKSLTTRAPRITAHDVDQPPVDKEEPSATSLEIDWGALLQ